MTIEATPPQVMEAPAESEAQEQPAPAVAPAPPPRPSPRAAEALRTLMDREARIREAEHGLREQQTQVEEARRMQRLATENPLQFLDSIGTSYEDLTQRVLQGDRPDPTAGVKREVAELRKELNTRQERDQESRQQAALQEAQEAVFQYVESSNEYPLTKAAEMQGLVFQRIYDHYNETGEALSEEHAATQVEEYLSGVVDKLVEIESIKNRFGVQEQVMESSPANTPTTLTNAHSSSTPTRRDEGMLSDSESLKRAAAMLQYVTNT